MLRLTLSIGNLNTLLNSENWQERCIRLPDGAMGQCRGFVVRQGKTILRFMRYENARGLLIGMGIIEVIARLEPTRI